MLLKNVVSLSNAIPSLFRFMPSKSLLADAAGVVAVNAVIGGMFHCHDLNERKECYREIVGVAANENERKLVRGLTVAAV